MKISDLPKEYRELVEKNRNEYGHSSEYVIGAFIYENTEEGYYFWEKVEKAKTTEELPKIVKI